MIAGILIAVGCPANGTLLRLQTGCRAARMAGRRDFLAALGLAASVGTSQHRGLTGFRTSRSNCRGSFLHIVSGGGLFHIRGMAATTLTGHIRVPTDFSTGRSLCIRCFELVVVGIDGDRKIRNRSRTSFIGEVLAAVGAGPVFNSSRFHTSSIDFFVIHLVLVRDSGNHLVTGDPLVTIVTMSSCCISYLKAGSGSFSVRFLVAMIV